MLSRDIPADGLSHYLESLWTTIRSNKDLDIPLQKVMLAVHRCGQISEDVHAQFTIGSAQLQTDVKASPEVWWACWWFEHSSSLCD
jgi:hypothetical protein